MLSTLDALLELAGLFSTLDALLELAGLLSALDALLELAGLLSTLDAPLDEELAVLLDTGSLAELEKLELTG